MREKLTKIENIGKEILPEFYNTLAEIRANNPKWSKKRIFEKLFELGEKKVGVASSLHLSPRGVPVGLMVILDDNEHVLARSNDVVPLFKEKKVLIREYKSKYLNRKKYIFIKYMDSN